jgi:hypothetical protein
MGALCEVCGHDMEEAASCVEMSVETVDGRLAPIGYGAEAEDWGAYPALPAMTGGFNLAVSTTPAVTLSAVHAVVVS